LLNAMSLPDYTINYTTPKDELKQRWLDSDNPFTAGKVTIPKDVTVLGGKTFTSKSNNYAALLTQNKYGEFYISIVFHAETESALMERMSEMLSQTNR
jgi:D-alanyl-D-alanine carboxypeptidase (penicillin-binding protein 5/6)